MPEYGIIGAGVALLVSYAVVVALMYAIVRRLFYVPYEWRRLATAVFLAAALIAIWETLVPHDGADGLALTLALCAAYPAGLWAARFLTEEERERLGALFARVRSGEVLRRDMDDREAAAESAVEQAARDADRRRDGLARVRRVRLCGAVVAPSAWDEPLRRSELRCFGPQAIRS